VGVDLARVLKIFGRRPGYHFECVLQGCNNGVVVMMFDGIFLSSFDGYIARCQVRSL
jgi:hypothetical protein